MNRNPKEKPERIEFRVTPREKKKIEQLAEKCYLTLSEYIRKRALGYVPRTVLPDAFYDFSRKLGELLNAELSPETEKAACGCLMKYTQNCLHRANSDQPKLQKKWKVM